MGDGSESRGRGRELALAALCHLEGCPPDGRTDELTQLLDEPPRGDGVGEEHFAELAADAAVRRIAVSMAQLVVESWAEIDAKITDTSKRWRLDRMDRVDRNVIRIVTAELLRKPETPTGVVLSEAVRLASRYGGDKSPKFVNGVARALADALRAEPNQGPNQEPNQEPGEVAG